MKTDEGRMLNNLTVAGIDLPEMYLLTKDHKAWIFESGEVVPTRPVLSGNNAINTHLSELLSEIIEPIVNESISSEIKSSEEGLAIIDQINTFVTKNGRPPEWNVLHKFADNDFLT